MAVAIVASSCQKDPGGSRHSGCTGGYSRRFQLENDPGRERFGLGSRRGRNDAFVCRDPHLLLADPFGGESGGPGVAKSAAPFRSAFTLPPGTENLYVQTTLPDGTKSVKMAGVHGTVAVTALR